MYNHLQRVRRPFNIPVSLQQCRCDHCTLLSSGPSVQLPSRVFVSLNANHPFASPQHFLKWIWVGRKMLQRDSDRGLGICTRHSCQPGRAWRLPSIPEAVQMNREATRIVSLTPKSRDFSELVPQKVTVFSRASRETNPASGPNPNLYRWSRLQGAFSTWE
ncbi:hypothetical protein BU26DRAFT_301895 [Trematosphaeria pertusa]|uniref:Uncharacterized protein n=1 Tax=Trematosphaeria pertusa TaxID=390896 RepID=A0A6A6IKS4_9PLEO|nr:uncharacterized protein BU26DRAFT_301895 [Trematosphaeria pertusa]KAF2250452.1 hypothetical protein BU26DRAFT_301895 [Trematosphaeria pertusa]